LSLSGDTPNSDHAPLVDLASDVPAVHLGLLGPRVSLLRRANGYRGIKQRLGWEKCWAWTKTPTEWIRQVQRETMSLMRLARFRVESAGEVDGWFPPPWNKRKDRSRVLDLKRLMPRHNGETQQCASDWLGDGKRDREDAA